MAKKIEIAADIECGCGERPTWAAQDKKLYFTDEDNPAMHCLDTATGKVERVYEGEDIVGAMTVHEDGRLLLFMARGAIRLWDPETREMETLLKGVDGEEESRFNDVLADPEGRVFCGTMPVEERQGRLYRWDPDGSLHTLLEEAGLPNGMGFSPDLKWFYFTDTQARTIQRFSYDQKTGAITEPTILVELGDENGNPDGLAVDQEGHLWSAHFGGFRLVRYSPEGKEVSRIELPMAENPTCPAFAGEGSSTLYVTTAGGGYRPQAGTAAGAVLKLEVDAKGKADFRSKGSTKAKS